MRAKKDPKLIYSYINSKNLVKNDITTIRDQSDTLTENKTEIANIINDHFKSVFTEDDGKIPKINKPQIKYEMTWDIINEITRDTIFSRLSALNENKSCGNDSIRPIVLKRAAAGFCLPLMKLFHISLTQGEVPKEWREANVCPIHKGGSKHEASNYRPISLTPLPCKILESLIRDKILQHLNINGLINPNQHGFVPNKSCMSNLLETIDFITYNLNSDSQTDIIYLDNAKAFDKVSHNKLLIKLESYSINISILKWIEAFLKNRKQRVVIGDSFSDWESVTSGVPQGTVLAPVLFVIYINDLPDQVKSMFKLYADDSKLGAKIENLNDCIQLQEDLDSVINWANEWQMTFNINKCHSVHFSNKKTLKFNFNYSMNNQVLEKSLIEKDLGILISSDLKWDNHISKITNKANSMLAMIKNSFECHDIEVIRPLYLALVRPQLEYVNSVWNPHLIRDIKK